MTPMDHETPQGAFRRVLLTVVDQAYGAAGYALDERPTQWAGGLFRFLKPLTAGAFAGMFGVIEYQHLYYPEDGFGRFRITLARTAQPGQAVPPGQQPTRRLLSVLVGGDFGVRLLPELEYWWSYAGVPEMGEALAESGRLAVGYGIPWLAGDLLPPGGGSR
ncbi:MAG: hypothetical protein L6Q98_11430 [Anaerolineae bacterium]|nr:hypothetical protein [Anaerolineae bacterium]NUQ05564.1 hypothetical protein [Anaerolineae bacterium]